MARRRALLAATLVATCAHAVRDVTPPTRPIALLTPVGFADHATAMAWIKSECDLPKTVEDDLVEVFRKTGLGGETTPSLARGYVVKVVIERANAQKGGDWSGGKTLSLSAQLYRDGVPLRSTEVSAEAKSWNLFAGSCRSLQNASGKTAPHVSEWLRNAELAKGDAPLAAASAASGTTH